MNKPNADSTETAAMAAPTEPALGPDGSPVPSLTIKRATLVAADGGGDAASSSNVRHIESYVGFIVDGRYQIESIIAQGGMGVVYLARHRLIEKPVALKILRPELVHNREITRRFLTEAQAASAIGSEHIVDVTDYGELPDGATYIVMEYLDGYSLNQRMQRESQLLPLPLVLSIARQIAEALQQAHDANIVHRDLKPDNVLLVTRDKRDDFVKILDFGIAKVASSQNQTTTAGRIFGTPHYMSPEQGRGDELDQRTDIYSLGVILYEMLCGQVPFDGENPLGILTQHMYVEVKPLTDLCPKERVSLGLQCVVARCLMKNPAERYSNMFELASDLARLERLEPPLALSYFQTTGNAPAHLASALKKATTRRLGLLLSALFAGASVVAIVVVGMLQRQPLGEEMTVPTTQLSPATAPLPEPVVLQEVMLVAEPIDAHVYRGKSDLGVIPLVLKLEAGKTVELTLRRPGYLDQTVVVDGSQSRIAVKLKRVSGVTVAPPPPTDAGVREARVVDLRQASHEPLPGALVDGGAPLFTPWQESADRYAREGATVRDEEFEHPLSEAERGPLTPPGYRPPSSLPEVELPPQNPTGFTPYLRPPGPPPTPIFPFPSVPAQGSSIPTPTWLYPEAPPEPPPGPPPAPSSP